MDGTRSEKMVDPEGLEPPTAPQSRAYVGYKPTALPIELQVLKIAGHGEYSTLTSNLLRLV